MMNSEQNFPVKEPVQNTWSARSLFLRLYRAIGPIAGGLILDSADLVTFNRFGYFLGPVIGSLLGWWIASMYGFSKPVRLIWAVLAAIYCTIPFTELLPLATLISAFARFGEKPQA